MNDVQKLFEEGSALFNAGQIAEAEPVFRRIIAIKPEDMAAHNCLAIALESAGRYQEAIKHYRLANQYAEGKPERPLIMLNLAIRLRETGHAQEALKFIDSAIELNPLAARLFSTKGNILRDLGNIEGALQCHLHAAQLNPDLQNNWNFLGTIYEIKQDFVKAKACFEKALALKPDDQFARANVADIMEKTGEVDAAEKLLEEAPESVRDTPSIRLGKARVKARQKDFQAAVDLLKDYDENASHEHHQRATVRHYDMGRYYDALGEYDLAFEHMQKGNEYKRLSPEAKNLNPQQVINEIIAHREAFSQQWFEQWTPSVPYEDGPAPVFLVGFPRSGTTLLDVILGMHSQTKILEEKPTTTMLGAEVMKLTGGALGGLMHFTPEQLKGLQQSYFKSVSELVTLEPGQRVVDKMPLATRYLDIFYRVFPKAKIIMTLRHPCDVLLSCYMQNFVPNRITLPLMDLKSAATLYAETMGLFEQFRAVMPMELHVVKYIDLVQDTEGETRKILEFLELPWDDNVLHHHKKSAGHVVTSASYAQVTEPIYKKSLGRWKHYYKHLEPIFPIIKPAADKFGYSLERD